MSTKIYDAYIFNGEYDDVLPLLKGLKKLTIDQLKYDISCKLIMDNLILSKHFPWISEDKKMSDLKWFDLSKILSDIFKNESLLDFYGFKSPSCIIYMIDGKIALQFFQIHSEIKKIIDSDDRIMDYHYQNSTDQSNYKWDEKWNDMSKSRKSELTKDWNDRKLFWDKVFDDYGTPIESGLMYNFVPWNFANVCIELLNDKKALRDIKINYINQ